jgi:putative aldouronate transport system substrate-binding protein
MRVANRFAIRAFVAFFLMSAIVGGAFATGGASSSDEVVITYTGPQVVAGYDYNTGDEYSKYILEMFDFEFQGTNVPWGDWNNMLATWIMAQDMTDVANFNYTVGTAADAAQFVEQGLLKRLPDDWKARWPGLAEVYETTALGPMLEERFGGTYFLPRARFFYNLPGNPLANHWSLWMRSDWIAAVGMEVRNHYTIPEVLEIGRRIMEQDPGNIGDALVPISMDTANAANFFLRANSTFWDTFYMDATGEYVWGAASEDTLEGLQLWYEAYSTGILDPEFYLLTYEEDMEKFQTLGTAGISYLGGQTADVERFRIDFTSRTGIDGDAFLLATLLGADGNYHQRDLINFWGTICFRPDVPDVVFERWMDLMEFTASPEGYPGTQMGIPGVDWDRDTDGEIISLVPPGTLLAGPVGEAKYPSLGHVLGSSILWDDLAFDNPNIGEAYRNESRALYANRYEFSTPETFTLVDWNLWLHNTENMRRAKGIDYTTEFANMVTTATSAANLTQIYRAWLQSQMGLIQPVLDELNQ